MSKSFFTFLSVFFATFFVDQCSKFLATIIGFAITYNSGVSFNFFSDGHPQIVTIGLVLLIYILFVCFQKEWKRHPVAAGLFFGGAMANLFDRVFFNAVRDWMPLPLTQIHNNIADWALFLGIILLVSGIMRKR